MNIITDIFKYFFDPTPPYFGSLGIVATIIAVLLVAKGIALKIYIKTNKGDKAFKRVFRDYPAKLITLGVLLGVYIFFRQSLVPFLSMRALMYADLITMVYVDYKMYLSYTKEYPELKKMAQEKEERNKYSVKKRHRK